MAIWDIWYRIAIARPRVRHEIFGTLMDSLPPPPNLSIALATSGRFAAERTAEGCRFRDLLDQFVVGPPHLLFAFGR
jgi:hypothetical protein